MVVEENSVEESWIVIQKALKPGDYYWKIVRENAYGSRVNEFGPRRFVFGPQSW